MNITFKGNPVTLLGEQVKVGDKAKNFTATKRDMSDYNLKDDLGKVVVLSVAPSIDTGVCELQTKQFNSDATKLSEDVKIITVTLDLPFAQKRFCASEGIENIEIVSDYKDRDFGKKYGFLIDELKLLTRGVVVIDREGIIKYVEYVQEVANSVDFDSALKKVKDLL